MEKLILASASPRRKELMGNMPYKFSVIAKETDENLDMNLSPQENVMKLASQKAMAVAADYPNAIVIGCDTVVVIDDKILCKPKDREDAKSILKLISGREHTVFTGVCILCLQDEIETRFYEMTKVKVKALTEDEVIWYINTGEPMDKAGAYGIQKYGSLFIEGIVGDYFNVVGLPVNRLYNELKKVITK